MDKDRDFKTLALTEVNRHILDAARSRPPALRRLPHGCTREAAHSSLKPECQHTVLCSDHPSTVDFSPCSGAARRTCCCRDHFITTRNGNRPQVAHLYALMVSKKSSWEQADQSHNVQTLFDLGKTPGRRFRARP